jgi:hypothetical protein
MNKKIAQILKLVLIEMFYFRFYEGCRTLIIRISGAFLYRQLKADN